jgi:hypothetical protein
MIIRGSHWNELVIYQSHQKSLRRFVQARIPVPSSVSLPMSAPTRSRTTTEVPLPGVPATGKIPGRSPAGSSRSLTKDYVSIGNEIL